MTIGRSVKLQQLLQGLKARGEVAFVPWSIVDNPKAPKSSQKLPKRTATPKYIDLQLGQAFIFKCCEPTALHCPTLVPGQYTMQWSYEFGSCPFESLPRM